MIEGRRHSSINISDHLLEETLQIYILIYELPQQQDKDGVMLVRMRSKLLGGSTGYGGSGIILETSFDSVRGLLAITQSFSSFAFISLQYGDISIGG